MATYLETLAYCVTCGVALRDHQLTARVADCPACGERYPLCGVSTPYVRGEITRCCTLHTGHDGAHEARAASEWRSWGPFDWELRTREILARHAAAVRS